METDAGDALVGAAYINTIIHVVSFRGRTDPNNMHISIIEEALTMPAATEYRNGNMKVINKLVGFILSKDKTMEPTKVKQFL